MNLPDQGIFLSIGFKSLDITGTGFVRSTK